MTAEREERQQGETPEGDSETISEHIPLARAALAEMLATFFLVLVSAGAAAVAMRSGGEPNLTARGIASGLAIVALVHGFSSISGSHKNPGVTLAFALRGAFPWARVPIYLLAQLLGGSFGAFSLRLILGPGDLGETRPDWGVGRAFGAEFVFSLFLYFVAVATAHRKGEVGPHAALAVGGVVAIGTIIAGPISGGSMNPARSIGPALASGRTEGLWIYIVAPVLASVLAAALVWILYPHRKEEEHEAAQGKPAH